MCKTRRPLIPSSSSENWPSIHALLQPKNKLDQFLDDVDAGRISEEELSGPGEFFAVRHLPDRRFIIQSLNHPKDAWNGSVRLREFNGHSDEYWWGLNPSGVISTDSPNGIYLLKRDKIEMDIFPIAYRQATEFFRLGMYEVDVNTIQIKETPPALAAKGEIPFQAEVLEGFGSGDIFGTLFTIEDRSGNNNRIARIRYSRSKHHKGIAGRLIELNYRNDQLSLVRISNYQKNGEKPSHYADYLVIKYIPAREPYPKGYCGWKQFTSESDGWVNIKQNGDEYDMDHNPPKLIPVEDGFKTPIFGNPLFNFAVIILIPLAIVWFLYRRSKRNQ